MANELQMVGEFEAATGFDGTTELRVQLLQDEVIEWQEAFAGLLKETADVMYVLFGIENAGITEIKDTELLIAAISIMDVMESIPVDLDEVFRRVHQSNMSKLVDGKALKRADGKILKGPNYQPPDLSDIARSI